MIAADIAYLRPDNAEEAVRRAIAALKPGAFAYEMDDGAVIRVRIDVDVAKGLAEQAERFKQEGSQLYKKV